MSIPTSSPQYSFSEGILKRKMRKGKANWKSELENILGFRTARCCRRQLIVKDVYTVYEYCVFSEFCIPVVLTQYFGHRSGQYSQHSQYSAHRYCQSILRLLAVPNTSRILEVYSEYKEYREHFVELWRMVNHLLTVSSDAIGAHTAIVAPKPNTAV